MENNFNTEPQIDADDDGLVDLAIDVTEAEVAERKAKREAVERKLIARAVEGIITVPIGAVSIWRHAAYQLEDMHPEDIEHEADIIETSGQVITAIGRRLDDGQIEIVGRSHLVAAVTAFNSRGIASVGLRVDIRKLDDKAAFRLAALEVNDAPQISAWARGNFYRAAIETFGSEAAVAKDLGVHKSTISRRLDVVRAVDILGDRLIMKQDVRQRDASWFISITGRAPDGTDAPDPEMAEKLLNVISTLLPMKPKALFAELRSALDEAKPQADVTPIAHDGQRIGAIRCKNGGQIRIDLTDAMDVELDALIELLREALSHVRTPVTL